MIALNRNLYVRLMCLPLSFKCAELSVMKFSCTIKHFSTFVRIFDTSRINYSFLCFLMDISQGMAIVE